MLHNSTLRPRRPWLLIIAFAFSAPLIFGLWTALEKQQYPTAPEEQGRYASEKQWLDYDILGTGRRPLVIVSGVTEQLPTADYISTVGGLTTNGSAPASGDVQTTTATIGTATVTTGNITTGNVTTDNITTATIGTAGITTDNVTTANITTANLSKITYKTQTDASTGTVNDQTLNATTTIFQWGSGAVSNVTFTGFTGCAAGRVLVVENVNATNQVSLSNLTGSSAGNQLLNLGNTTAVLKGLGSSATYICDGSEWRMTSISSTQYDALITFNNSSTVFKGATFSLSAGGTQFSATGSIQTQGSSAHFIAKISSGESVTCGSNPVVLGTDNAGTITIGTTSGGNCTVTFGVAYTTNAPGCIVRFRDQTTNSAFVYTTSTTALTITGASDGKTFDYFCWGSA